MTKNSNKKHTEHISKSRQRSIEAQKLTAHINKSASKSLLELRRKA